MPCLPEALAPGKWSLGEGGQTGWRSAHEQIACAEPPARPARLWRGPSIHDDARTLHPAVLLRRQRWRLQRSRRQLAPHRAATRHPQAAGRGQHLGTGPSST
eukprot:5909827-Prymnesium_polylepis.1